MPRILTDYRQGLEEELWRALEGPPDSLSAMLQYHLGWEGVQGQEAGATQGKAFRPSLCLFTAEAVGGSREAALLTAAALELVHNFSLIHDDIQDEDVERRHRPTVWARWGKPQGIVAGNAMRVLADLAALASVHRGTSAALILEVSRILTQRYLEMVHGQVLDLAFEREPRVSVDAYLGMISRKSGALMDAAMELGALVGCGDPALGRQLGRCGRLLGLAFQLRDDLLGVWGDEEMTGKAVGADLRRRKKVFPVVYALEHARGRAAQMLQRIYASANPVTDDEVLRTLAILDQVHAFEVAQCLAEEQCQQALELAAHTPLGPHAQNQLAELAHFVLQRLS